MGTSVSSVRPYNLRPIVILAVFSSLIAVVSSVALGLLLTGNMMDTLTVLSTPPAAAALTMCTTSVTICVLTCIWGYHRNKLQKEAIKEAHRREAAKEEVLTLDTREIDPNESLADDAADSEDASVQTSQAITSSPSMPSTGEASTVAPSLGTPSVSTGTSASSSSTSTPSSGVSTSSSSALAKPTPVKKLTPAQARRAVIVADQAAKLPALIHRLIGSVTNLLTALSEKHNGSKIVEGSAEQRAFRAAAKKVADLVPPIAPAELDKFYAQSKYELPIPLMGAMDVDRLADFATVQGQDPAAVMARREEAVRVSRQVNMCARPLELLKVVLDIAGILEMLGDTKNAGRIAEMKALKAKLQAIIDNIPSDSEEVTRKKLNAFIQDPTFPNPDTFVSDWVLSSDYIASLRKTRKFHPDSQEGLRASYIGCLVTDLAALRSVFPGCFDSPADTPDDSRALASEFAKITPHITIQLKHMDALNLFADKVLPMMERILKENDVYAAYEMSMQFSMWLQSLAVLSLPQAYKINLSDFGTVHTPFPTHHSVIATVRNFSSPSMRQAVLDNLNSVLSTVASFFMTTERKPAFEGIKGLQQVLSYRNFVVNGWDAVGEALGWRYIRQKLAQASGADGAESSNQISSLIPMMLGTVYQLLRPDSPFRAKIMPILADFSELRRNLKGNEITSKSYLDIALVVTYVINHCDQVAAKIRSA